MANLKIARRKPNLVLNATCETCIAGQDWITCIGIHVNPWSLWSKTTTIGSLLHRFWWTDLMKTGTRRAHCTTIYELYCRPHVATPVVDQYELLRHVRVAKQLDTFRTWFGRSNLFPQLWKLGIQDCGCTVECEAGFERVGGGLGRESLVKFQPPIWPELYYGDFQVTSRTKITGNETLQISHHQPHHRPQCHHCHYLCPNA